MAENPIKYSELIQPDDSIEKLVKQLDEANDAYNNLANSIKAQAVSISASLKTVSGATEGGRASTRRYSEAAEKLLKAERDLNFARSETARRIAELNAARKAEQTEIKLLEQYNRSAEGSYNKLAAQYGLLKMQLNAMSEEMRKNTVEGQKLEQQAKDIYEEMKRLQEATGKNVLNVGNYQSALDGLLPIQNKWMDGMEKITELTKDGVAKGIKMAGEQLAIFGKRMLALLANPIVATIAAIAAVFLTLVKAIKSSDENTRALEVILAPFQRTLTAVMSVLQGIAGWLLKGVEGMEKMAMAASRFMEKMPLVGNAIKKVNDALAENIALTKAKHALEDADRKAEVDNAKRAMNAAKFRADAEKTSDPRQRIRLLKMANIEEERITDDEYRRQKERVRILREQSAQSQNDAKTKEDLAHAEARLYEIKEGLYQKEIRLNSKIRRNTEKLNNDEAKRLADEAKAREKALEEAKRQAEERYKTELSIARKLEDLRIEGNENDFDRKYAQTAIAYERQIEDIQHLMVTDVEHREQYNAQIIQLESNKGAALQKLLDEQAQKDAEAIQKQKDAELKAKEEALRTQMDVIDQTANLRQLEIENMETSEYEKNRLSIEAEKERLKAIYDLNVQAGKDLTSLEMRTLQEQMKKLDQEAQKNKKNRDIFDMLGFNLTDEKKEAISTSFQFAMDQLSNYMNAWVQAAEAKAQLAEQEVERAQNVLDAEIEARNQGYASDVETARKELELAKSNQQKALKEKEKAQKAQLALQTVEQAANLITATSLIWSQLGFPWAIPAIAVMWGSFAAAKIKALEATKSGSEEYGEGTVELLNGGSHQSGNDVDLGRKKDGTRRRAEGGEFFAVINKRNSRKYRNVIPDIINSLNAGTFEQKYAHAYDGADAIAFNVQQGNNPDLRGLSSDVRAIREQGDRQSFTDSRGTHVVYKNLHRIYKN